LEGQQVYEVGPGPGGLTGALLDAGARVTAVERDRRCLPALADLEALFPGRLTLIEEDALKVAEEPLVGRGAHVVSNLPYNVGTALLLRWLAADWLPWWASLTLMFQKEVAKRIVAKPGDEAYGRLSVAAQWRASPRIALAVHRSAFVPPPKVTSAVVHIVPAEEPEGVRHAVLEGLTAAAFGQRRKMLRQSLKAWKAPWMRCRRSGSRPNAGRDGQRGRVDRTRPRTQFFFGAAGASALTAIAGPRWISSVRLPRARRAWSRTGS
jgi:16S rRNA (adenine1518-N6/adenine1519-N6)-dimethyltransferase